MCEGEPSNRGSKPRYGHAASQGKQRLEDGTGSHELDRLDLSAPLNCLHRGETFAALSIADSPDLFMLPFLRSPCSRLFTFA